MTGAEFGEVDIDVLADYIGGALTGTPEESAVAALIADDPAWHAAYASLRTGMAAVGDELGRLGPEPMPADLAARLDAAFASPIADAAPIDAELAAPPIPHLALVRDPDGSTDRTGAKDDDANVQGEGARGALEAGRIQERKGHGHDRDGHGPGRVPERKAGPPRGRRLRWAAPIAVAAGVIAFVGFGLDYLSGQESDRSATGSSVAAGSAEDAKRAPALASPQRTLASGTDYTADTLTAEPAKPMTAPGLQVPGARRPATPESRHPTTAAAQTHQPTAFAARTDQPPALQRLTAQDALRACLASIEQENASGAIAVESVDYARYAGQPAIVVRFTAADGRWAWASGPTCGTPGTGADTLAKAPVR